jgi:hypothetical protein
MDAGARWSMSIFEPFGTHLYRGVRSGTVEGCRRDKKALSGNHLAQASVRARHLIALPVREVWL